MKTNEAIQPDISRLLAGRKFVKPAESQADKADLRLLGLELELAPFQFYRDEGIVSTVPGNPAAKGGCIPIMDRTNGTTLVHIRYVETNDHLYNIVVRSHEEAEASILLGKTYELWNLLAKHKLPVDQVMQEARAISLDKTLLNGQACFALGSGLPRLYYPNASEYLAMLRALPHDAAKEE